MSWICSTCGQRHDDIPFSFAADFPDNYANLNADEREARALIGSDQCILDEKECYIRGLVELPIHGENDPFLWGVWAAMWPEDFDEVAETWETEGRENTTGPFKGRLGNRLQPYTPTTADLKLTIHIRPVGQRPAFIIDEPEHPLAIAQRNGMTLTEARELASAVLHQPHSSLTN